MRHFCDVAQIYCEKACSFDPVTRKGCVEVEVQKAVETWRRKWVDPEIPEEEKELFDAEETDES